MSRQTRQGPLLAPAVLMLLSVQACASQTPTSTSGPEAELAQVGVATAKQAAASPTEHVIKVEEGVSLHVIDWGGEGPVLLFVPSWSATSHVFDGFASRFADDYRVLVMNMRGHGPSSRPDHGYTIERLTQDIEDVLDALDIRKVTLVGLSRSASLTTQFAAGHPERVTSLVYLSGPIDRDYAKGMFTDPDARARAAARRDADVALSALCGVDDSMPLPPGSIDEAANEVGVEWRNTDPAPPYAAVAAPALAFWEPPTARAVQFKSRCADVEDQGTVNQHVDAYLRGSVPFVAQHVHDTAIFQQQLRRSTIVLVPDATYYVYLTNPELVESEMRAFLSGVADK